MTQEDVQATLGELERKLAALESELATASPRGATPRASAEVTPAAPAPPPVWPPATSPAAPPSPAAVSAAQARLGGLQVQLDELLRFRGELERATRGLLEEYDRVLGGLGLLAAPASAPVPAHDEHPLPAGSLVVDAGPFADLAGLSDFEQALLAIPGVADVYVRGFDANRVVIDVTLRHPVALGAELRRTTPVAFTLAHTGPGSISIAFEPGA